MLPSDTFPVLTPKVATVVTALCDKAIPLTLVLGDAGLGKTYAVSTAVGSLDSEQLLIDATPGMSAYRLAEAILREARENPLLALAGDIFSRNQLAEVVTGALDDVDALIVIDDADHLTMNALAWLACLHARDVARLVLIGTPALTHRLPTRLCQVACSIRFEPIPEDMVCSVVRQLHPIYTRAHASLIARVNERYCEGVLARWARFTDHASGVCSVERIRHLNDYVVRAVLDHFEELDEAA